MVSLGLLAALFLGFAASMSVVATQREAARERLVAVGALSDFVENQRRLTLAQLLALSPSDVPSVGKLTVSGGGLKDAAGLFVRVSDENPPVSAVLSATDKAALGFTPLGFDLNGDGDTIDAALPAERLTLLPAKVALRWTSRLGEKQEATLYVYFSDH